MGIPNTVEANAAAILTQAHVAAMAGVHSINEDADMIKYTASIFRRYYIF